MKRRGLKGLAILCAAAMLLTSPVSASAAQLPAAETETEMVYETEEASDLQTETQMETVIETVSEPVVEASETEAAAETETEESESETEIETESETETEAESETFEQVAAPGELDGEDLLLDMSPESGNRNYNSYSHRNWYHPVWSYLVPQSDGFMRVEYQVYGNGKVLIEKLDQNGKTVSSRFMDCELPIFGGFFAGSDAYYMVFGQMNPEENDETEVVRVVKYDKNWNRLAAASVKGANTYEPFAGGSLVMQEADGLLIIHTCHQMYINKDDGERHQANMTIQIRESDMTVADGLADVSNNDYGYVSHSFNQLMRIKGGVVYRLDHGDALPRGLMLTAFDVGNRCFSLNASYPRTLTTFQGASGNNYTGASVGGFEISATHALVALNRDSSFGSPKSRVVCVMAHDLAAGTTKYTYIPKLDDGTEYTPRLVKVNDDLFLLMWARYDGTDTKVRVVRLDGTGTPISGIEQTDLQLSDCEPVLLSDGTVVWYVTDGSSLTLYKYDPRTKAEPSVELDKDKVILSIGDTFSLRKAILPAWAADGAVWSSSRAAVATVDQNGKITAKDSGQAVITLTLKSGQKASCTVTVRPPVKSIRLDRTSMTVGVGRQRSLTATVLPKDAIQDVIWTSSDTSVAEVSTSGTIFGRKEGKTTITATTVNGLKASCEIRVYTPVDSVTLNKNAVTLEVGASETLTFTVDPADADDQVVSWSSSLPDYVGVDQKGKITAIKPIDVAPLKAVVTVRVQTNDTYRTASVHVSVKRTSTSIHLDQTSLTLSAGRRAQLTATLLPADTTDKTVIWSSSNNRVVTVAGGLLTAVAPGTATITVKAKDSGKTATCSVKVDAPVTSVTLDQTKLSVDVGKTVTLKATVLPENAENKKLKWTSLNTDVVKVDQTGKVTGLKAGTAQIRVSSEDTGKTAYCTVTVNNPVTSIRFNTSGLTLTRIGSTAGLSLIYEPADATDKKLTWTSSNEKVATVNSYGRVTATGIGKATITAKTANGKTASIEVIVAIPATDVKLNKANISLTVGQTETLIATVAPEDASDKTLTWTSSDESVAKADKNGKVTAVGAGTANITVMTSNGRKSSCFVRVTKTEVWERLYGTGRYDTMQAIVKAGFKSTGGTVVVATGASFKDALAAAGLAGIYKGPVILTDGKSLSSQARTELVRLKPARVYVAGGTFAVSETVFNRIKKLTGADVERVSGANSCATSAGLALAGQGSWSDTAIIATNKSFKDALSAAPLSYALHMPIFLSDNGKSLSSEVLSAMKTCRIKKVIIVGGSLAVSTNVETQLGNNNITNIRRIGEQTAVQTSAAIAKEGISRGLGADNMGVATSQNFPDALAGAAFCGYNRSVLVLADDKAMYNTSFPTAYKHLIKKGYVFGGPGAVGDKTMKALEAAVK